MPNAKPIPVEEILPPTAILTEEEYNSILQQSENYGRYLENVNKIRMAREGKYPSDWTTRILEPGIINTLHTMWIQNGSYTKP